MARRVDREGPIQRQIVTYLRIVLPDAIVHHCKNEIKQRGKAIQIELAKAKANGVVKGFPDLIVIPLSTLGPFFLEVKAPGNYPTDAQRLVHKQMENLGYRVAVVRSVDDVRARLEEWSIPTQHIEFRGAIS